ncbi:PHD finger protein 19-like isoform X2 [Lineus longissimus]|uniref:PHD finger protein 19-like isoform X2 n=1 Tax=Lineus longissimus TaxID=88925 RepID=UPI002B4D9C1D
MTEVASNAALGKAPKTRFGERFIMGQEVLARWSDGLFYLGNILTVDDAKERCCIRFEDDSEYWSLFKDIQRGIVQIDPTSDIYCRMCHTGKSDSPNEIVLCDGCGIGYHQQCHKPVIQSSILKPDVSWVCRNCVFATTAKRGGADKEGPNSEALLEMKKSLPYNAKELKWDNQHKTNNQQIYCYCGGPGDWYLKMLQCCRCNQWFHEACIQCLDMPIIYGDRFYIFVCSCCNAGPEYIKRLDLKMVDILHLALFDLTIRYNKKYYDFDETILPWITNHVEYFKSSKIVNMAICERKEEMTRELINHRTKFDSSQTMLVKKRRVFQSGREIKKKATLFGLRVRAPPQPPVIQLPANGQITDDVMNNLKMKGKKVKTFVPVTSTSPVPLKWQGTHLKRRASTDASSLYMYNPAKKRLVSECSESSEAASNSDSAISFNQNYLGYTGHSSAYLSMDDSDMDVHMRDEDTLPLCPPPLRTNQGTNLLDTLIPVPKSFEGMDHPFKTILEKNQDLENFHAKVRLLGMCRVEYDFDDCSSLAGSDYGSTISMAMSGDSLGKDSQVASVGDTNVLEHVPKKRGRKSKREKQLLSGMANGSDIVASTSAGRRKRRRKQSSVPDLGLVDSSSFADSGSVVSVSSADSMIQLAMNCSCGVNPSPTIESFQVRARRALPDGKVQYLLEWEKGAP